MTSVIRGFRQLAFDCWRSRISYLFLAPFMICFIIFIIIPVVMAILLSFTSYNAFETPKFSGLSNYIALITQDLVFLKYALPNTLKFALFVGPGGYVLSFIFAWLIYQLPKKMRDFYTLAFYAPSLAGGTALTVVWAAAFSGDRVGYLNYLLLKFGFLDLPVVWLQDPRYLLNIMIIVSLWISFNIGFLSMLGGLATVNPELYEAGRIDGITNRLQEVYFITIPSMKPQMLFSAVMTIVTTLKAGQISVQLTGLPITPRYSGHLIINHVDDFAFQRYELGYASAISVVLLVMSYLLMRFFYRILKTKEGEE
ncbi:ABC transporter permease [Paenibacillus baekrokdamisoli]|uniref:ABC transporter permease n=1 Tax=Paenibacillus baekrokdamisoli TaxID=1712516 RepID=A0A3G9JB72_9BACL|nr:sugar ABC transporter permease [Paenibacillus baekrokdamisoli]MBB3070898.1 multiple sugar transport system permease protein [Paenibacillus baekrokdamisoli]BBH22163.1 ABC transporter permease [Paenibacillus baekrokdamisoli]